MATTYHVAKTGNDANPGTAGSPKLTINGGSGGISLLAAGDTLVVHAGTYAENLINPAIPSGSSGAAYTRIIANTGDTVTLAPASGDQILYIGNGLSYIEFDGINLDGASITDASVFYEDRYGYIPHHLRFQNATVHHREGVGQGNAAFGIGGHDHEFLNLSVHGTGGPYGFYIAGDYCVIDGCDIYDTSSAGIHIYHNGGTPTGNIVRNCRVRAINHSAFFGAPAAWLWGILVAGNGNQIYNNRVYDIAFTYASGNYGILVFNGVSNIVTNNTIYNNTTDGIGVSENCALTRVYNNIVYGNTQDNVYDGGSISDIKTNLKGVDPLFVNAGARDFHLASGSPAIDTGTTNEIATTDADGVARLEGLFDIGAYEVATSSPGTPWSSPPVAHIELALGPNGGTTSAIDTTGADLLVVFVAGDKGNTATVTDSKSNTYTARTAVAAATYTQGQFFLVEAPSVGSGHTFTVSGTGVYASVFVTAWSGSKAPTSRDAEAGATGTDVTVSPGAILPTQPGALVLVGVSHVSNTAAINAGYSKIGDVPIEYGSNEGGSLFYRIQTGAAPNTDTPTITLDIPSLDSVAMAIAFLPAVTGGGTAAEGTALEGVMHGVLHGVIAQ